MTCLLALARSAGWPLQQPEPETSHQRYQRLRLLREKAERAAKAIAEGRVPGRAGPKPKPPDEWARALRKGLVRERREYEKAIRHWPVDNCLPASIRTP